MIIRFSGKARADPIGAYRYIAERNPTAADNFIADVDRKLNQLVRFPHIGRDRAEFSHGLRSVVVLSFLIFYKIGDGRIEIVRVIDGRMDIHQELQR